MNRKAEVAYPRRIPYWMDSGVYFEPLEPRLLLDGSLDSVVDSPLAESQPNTGNACVTESSIVCERDISSANESQNRIADPPANQATFDLLAGMPAMEAVPEGGQGSADLETASLDTALTTRQASHAMDVVLIDTRLEDSALLPQGVLPDAKLFLYDSSSDSTNDVLSRVIDWAESSDIRIDSLAILSHGAPGAFELGNRWITAATLDQTAAEWQRLGQVLAAGANIDLFGCNVAETGSDGQLLIDRLADLTGADVFASNDASGKGGDWVLEVNSAGDEQELAAGLHLPLDVATLGKSGASLAWYDANWAYRKQIVIDHTKVSGTSDLTNFPVLISFTDASFKSAANGGNVGQDDGGDFVFTSSDGTTKLDHQIDSYDPITGTLLAWVEVQTLSYSADTQLYVYYGNASAADQWNINGTWESNFNGVWHLGSDYSDSTVNAHTGTNSGSTNYASANIGDGDDFNGTNAYISTASTEAKTANAFTLSAWFNADSTAFGKILIWEGESTGNGWGDAGGTIQEMHLSIGDVNTSGNQYANYLTFFLGNSYTSTNSINLATAFTDTTGWHHVAVTVSAMGTSPSATMYLDGVAVDTDTGSTAVTSRSDWDTGLRFGGPAEATRYFDGGLDEVHLAATNRTAGWIATEYNNQNSPDTFISLVSEETTPEDTGVVFSSANGNQIALTDADAGSNQIPVTLSVTNGTLTLNGTTGLTFTAGDGTADATMTFKGTLANVNNALNGLTYTPTGNYNGSATLTVTQGSYLNADTTLKGRYTFDNTGALGNDSSPAGAYDGTVSGASSVVDSPRGNVLSFDGNDYVQMSGHFGNPTNATLAAWVNLTNADTYGSEVISLGDSLILRLDDPTNGVIACYCTSSGNWTTYVTNQFLEGTGWHHVACTFDDANNTMKIYIDGVSCATTSAAGYSVQYINGANSFLGKHGDGETSFDFIGRMDDARVYSRVLSAAELGMLCDDSKVTHTTTVAITVTPVNDAPVLAAIEGTSLAYTENDAATSITSTITASDADNTNLAGATIQVTGNYQSGQDVLSFTNTVNITGSWNATTGALTLSGSDTVANYQAALRAVKYENTGENPGSLTRTVSVAVNNGELDSNTLTRNIAVTPVNDLLDALNDSATAQTNTPADINVTANDTDGESEPITIVELTTPAHGTATSSGGTVTYTSTAGYSGPDSVQYMAFDSGAGLAHYWGLNGNANDSVGGSNGTITGTTTVTGDFASALRFNETSDRVTIPDFAYASNFSLSFAFKLADNTGTVFQYFYSHGTVENANSLAVYVGEASNGTTGYRNMLFTSLQDTNDAFDTSTLGVNIGAAGLNLIGDGNWHTYTLTVSAADGAKVYVDGALQESDSGRGKDSFNPAGSVYVGARSDLSSTRYYGGDLDTLAVFGSALSSTEVSDLAAGANRATLSLTVNAPPVISLPGGALTYTENDAATVIDSGATATDDSADFDTGTLTVDFSANGSGDDRLAIRNQGTGAGQIGVSGSDVTYGGVTIGTFSGGSGTTPLVVTFNTSSTPAAAQALMRNVTFENVSDTPSTLARTVRFVLTDGDGGISNTAAKTINVTGVDDAPVVAAIEGTPISYGENDPATTITDTITLSDADNANLAGATIRIAANYQNGQDVLSFTDTGTITGSWDAETGTLTLSGADTVANYQAALRSVKYQNTSDDPSDEARTVTFKVTDGTADSNVLTRNIELTPVNDPPVLLAIEGTALPYSENDPATAVTATLAVSDADSTNLEGATIQITGNYQNGEDVLSFTDTATITGSWSAATGMLTLSGTDTSANYQAALRAVKYQNTSEDPSNLTRTLTFKVDDGTAESDAVTRDIALTPVNDEPVLAAIEGAALGYTENGAATPITATITASDADSTNLEGATIQITGNYQEGQDVLSFTNTANIAGCWNAATGMLTLSGEDTVANYQAALRSVKYQNTSDNPSDLTRTVTFLVNDGMEESSAVTRDIALTPVNDAPVLDLDANNSSGKAGADFAATFTEDGGPVLIADSDASLSDVDSPNLQSLTVTITNPLDGASEVLSADTTDTSISAAYANGVLTLSGEDTVANYLQVLGTVSYNNTVPGDPNTTPRTITFVANDGTAGSNIGTATVTVVAVDTTPDLDLDDDDSSGEGGADFAAAFTEDGGPVLIADSDATLSDADSENLLSLTVTITNRLDGASEVLAADTSNTSIGASYENGVLTLSGEDTVANYQKVLRTITYNNSSDTPNTTARSITFVARDETGNGNVGTATLSVTQADDAPVLTLDADNSSGQGGVDFAVNFIIGGGEVSITDGDATLSDVDSANLQSLTVTITNLLDGAGELLEATTGGTAINASYEDGVLTLSGEDTLANYQQVLRTITYNNVAGSPNTTARIISFVANDLSGASNHAETIVNCPAIDLDGDDSGGRIGADFAATFIEKGGAVAIADTDATLSNDAVPNLVSLTVTITNQLDGNKEVLSADTSGTSISASYNQNTGVLSLEGDDILENYQQVLRTITYNNTTPHPDLTDRIITFVAKAGSTDTNIATTTVTVIPRNDPPVLDLDEDNSSGAGADFAATFTENGGEVSITDVDATITDEDSNKLDSLTVTITNLLDGANEVLAADTDETSIIASYANGVLTLEGDCTAAEYQQVLRTVTYNNTSENPNTAARSITFTANDGTDFSNVGTTTLSIVAQNDAPVLDLDANNSSGEAGADFAATFTENGGAVAIADSDAALSDVDSANLQSLTVTITNPLDGASEVLAANTSGTSITAAYANGVLTLSGADTPAHYQQILQTVTYNNTSENPNPTARSITFTASDGAAGSNVGTTTLSIVAQNDAPVLASIEGPAVSYTENGAAKTVTATITASDADHENLNGATIQITGNYHNGQDVLSFTDTAGITGTWDALTGTLTLSGADTVGNYQLALRAVKYRNTSDNPSGLTRTVSFTVSDGANDSNLQSRNITVTPVNDAPVLAAIEGVALPYTENDPATPVTAAITAADADNAQLTYATIQIIGNYQNGEDLLSFTDTAGITGSWDALTGTLTLSGSDTAANYQAALRAVTYENTSEYPNTLTRTVSFKVGDGTTDSNLQTRSIALTPANDAPVLATIGGAALSYTENDAATALTAAITAADVDSANLAGATIQITGNYQNGEDVLSFSDTGSISGSWDAGTGTLTLSGSDTVANYQAALRAVTYENTSENPSGLTRTVSFTAGDGGALSNTVTRDIALTPVNDAPGVTSDGGGASAVVGVAENAAAVTTVTSTDPDGGAPAYSISGGPDGAIFTIDPASGELAFATAPDRENPGDSDADNVYEVVVQVSDGNGGTDSQAIAVSVTDVDEFDMGAVADMDGSADAVDENAPVGTTVGVTASAVDADATDNTVTYTLDDDAGGRFAIDGTTGVVTVAGALDRETDAAHTITVRATSADGSFSTKGITIGVNDVDESTAEDHTDSEGGGIAESAGSADTASVPEDRRLSPYADLFDAISAAKAIDHMDITYDLDAAKQNEDRPGEERAGVLHTDFGSTVGDTYGPERSSAPPADTGFSPANIGGAAGDSNDRQGGSMDSFFEPQTREYRPKSPGGKTPRGGEIPKQGEKDPSPEQTRSGPMPTDEKGPEPGVPLSDGRVVHLSKRARDLITGNPMFKEMDIGEKKISQEAAAQEISRKVTAGAAVVVGASLLGGYAIWVLRGMSLLASALSAVPLWKFFDPLPILSRSKRGSARGLSGVRDEDEEDGEKRLDDVLSRKRPKQEPESRKGKKG